MQFEVMLDIEALGTRPGAAIFELAAVAFHPESGPHGETFFRKIVPAEPFVTDLETLEWHSKQGTWPREADGTEITLRDALLQFNEWFEQWGEVDRIWSWGSTYDFPLMETGFQWSGVKQPYKYHRCCDARTIWNVAFPGVRTAPRPHQAVADVEAAIIDLRTALMALRGQNQ